jgi:exodeoxyribonuclease V alpha subunit
LKIKEQLQQKLTPIILKNFTAYLQARDPFLALKLFNQFRVLCAMRHGAFGVLAINRLIETILSLHFGIKPNTRWYHGRPIMVTRNDYHLRLFNGDTGLILQLPNMPEAQAFFFDAESPDGLRQVWPNRLPEHETVYAMTIHKSQGSEFDEVLLLIPDQISNLLTRELLYTGMTRAKKYLYLMGNREVIIEAMSRRIKRNSGLVMQFESLSENLGN